MIAKQASKRRAIRFIRELVKDGWQRSVEVDDGCLNRYVKVVLERQLDSCMGFRWAFVHVIFRMPSNRFCGNHRFSVNIYASCNGGVGVLRGYEGAARVIRHSDLDHEFHRNWMAKEQANLENDPRMFPGEEVAQ